MTCKPFCHLLLPVMIPIFTNDLHRSDHTASLSMQENHLSTDVVIATSLVAAARFGVAMHGVANPCHNLPRILHSSQQSWQLLSQLQVP